MFDLLCSSKITGKLLMQNDCRNHPNRTKVLNSHIYINEEET